MPTFDDWNLLNCSNCKLEPHSIAVNENNLQTCTHCGKQVSVHVYPALLKTLETPVVVDAPVIGEESSCFYHPQKQAMVVCDDCGRFLCNLCDIEMNGRHVCTACLEIPVTNEASVVQKNKFVHYDTIALLWAVACILMWFFSALFSIISLYYCIRHWNTPISATPRNRWRFVVAALFSTGVLCAWGFVLLQLFLGVN